MSFNIDIEKSFLAEDITIGAWKAKMKGDQLCIEFEAANKEVWSWSSCLDKTLISDMEKVGQEEVNFTRDQGTFVLSGNWKGRKGSGTYVFNPSSSITERPTNTTLSDKAIIELFMNEIRKENELLNDERGLYDPRVEVDLTTHLRSFAGVMVRGDRGNAKISIRGIGSFSFSNEPLIILDNGPVGSYFTLYNSVNIASIKRIEVLKNPNDIAIYGVRGMNGVIKVTTKNQ